MIFVTIGTQEPFDRLICMIDDISYNLNIEIIAQTSVHSNYKPKNIQVREFLTPNEFDQLFDEAELIIAHAGMGTIISALMKKKALIVVPRKKELGEHRSDHQMATVKYLGELGYLNTAQNKDDLIRLLDLFDKHQNTLIKKEIGPYASPALTEELRSIILD
ncbi:glycosyltransferase [Zhouia sp. PK063]|uniref:glycosyltransferase n=1 Tax=Zhouia sp. PK063 TaxID=3373602 RepID=UPI003791A5E4